RRWPRSEGAHHVSELTRQAIVASDQCSAVELHRTDSARPCPAPWSIEILHKIGWQNLLHCLEHALGIRTHAARIHVVVSQRIRHRSKAAETLQAHPHLPVFTRAYVLTKSTVSRQGLSLCYDGRGCDGIAITEHFTRLCRVHCKGCAPHS